MADTEDTPTPDTEGVEATATAEPDGGESAPVRLNQTVDIKDIGPCKKHIKVTIDRGDIDARLDTKYSELVTEHRSFVQGFRPGVTERPALTRALDRLGRVGAEVLGLVINEVEVPHSYYGYPGEPS